jgi:apolipoprotein N-acyltransferase
MQASVVTPNADTAAIANESQSSAPVVVGNTVPTVRLKLLALALVSGGMLWMCHFPLAWGWLGWVALVPLLPLIRSSTSGWWRYGCAWLAGTVYFWAAISWMTVADTRMVACWAMLSLYCSLYFPLAIWMVWHLERGTRLPLVLTFPAVWIALEWFRSWFATGFSWYLLAHTQHDTLQVIQIADLGGAFAVSFLVAAVNVVVFEALTKLPAFARWLGIADSQPGRCCSGFALQLVFVVALLCGSLAYGAWCLSRDEFEPGPRIALLQGNLDQRLRIAAHRSPEAQAKVQAAYTDLCMQAARLHPRPDLIVWPETSYPGIWVTFSPHIDGTKISTQMRKQLALEQEPVRMVGLLAQTNVLLGLNTLVLAEKKELRYNSALLLDPQGMDLKRYDKIHRVPFGEYVPLRDWLPFMSYFAPYDFDYSIGCGDGLTRFTLGKHKFGVLVCYEDTDPFMARDYGVTTADGPPVDFLLNISNDGWFDGSSEHEEHLAISRFRAIEARRALARSVNMGISAVIDSTGRVIAPVKSADNNPGPREVWSVPPDEGRRNDLNVNDWHQYKKTEGILVFDVPIDHRTSLYATCGDWLPYTCWALIGGSFLRGRWKKLSRLPLRRHG